VVAVLLPLIALAGCGSEDENRQSGVASVRAKPQPSVSAAASPDAVKFTQCLREHNINVRDLDANGRPKVGDLSGVSAADLRAAYDACRQYAPQNITTISSADRQRMLDYTKCLRQQGIDIGDPDPTTGRPKVDDMTKIANPDQKMKEAQRACAEYAPSGLRGQGR
jgi:hypothetical protein